MTKLDPLEAYQMYVAIKHHFTSNYDYFKYHGKVKHTDKEHFEKRKDKSYFFKMASTFSREELEELLVANFLQSTSIWAADVVSREGKQTYQQHKQRLGSLEYTFKQDVRKLLQTSDKFLNITDGYNPEILMALYANEISIETFIILNDILNFFPYFNEKLNDNILWPIERDLCIKYKPFLKFDKQNYKDILNSLMQEMDK